MDPFNQLQPADATFWTRWKKPAFLEKSVGVNDAGEKHKRQLYFWLVVEMLLQSAAMVATKLLENDKISAWIKQMSPGCFM